MNKAIPEFYMRFMVENSKDQGKLFRAAKKLLTTENKLSFLDHVDKDKLTNETAELMKFLDAMEIHVNETHSNISLGFEQRPESFYPLTKSDVCALIQKSAKKSCMLDPMPTSLVT
ncbi:hypothetical protein pdam_00019044, partial [Pocillopora damicornis]